MNLVFNRHQITDAFKAISGVINPRTPKEILKSVKLQWGGNRFLLLGSDSEINMRVHIDVPLEESGESLIPVARVNQILSTLREDTVAFSITSKRIDIKSGPAKFSLATENAQDFPPIEDFTETDFYQITAANLRTLISQTVFAVDETSTRYSLGGLCMELDGDIFTMVSTDSRRLAAAQSAVKVVGKPEWQSRPVIPEKAAKLIKSVCTDGDVQFAIRPNSATFRTKDSVIVANLVTGRFPDYKAVIRSVSAWKTEFVAGPLLSAIRQSMIVKTNTESRGVDFVFGNGTLKLSSEQASVGESVVEIPISHESPQICICLDPNWFVDYLSTFEPTQLIEIGIETENHPVTLTTPDYQYVIMPIGASR